MFSRSRAQSGLEFLLVFATTILVAVLVVSVLTQSANPIASGIEDTLSGIQSALGGGQGNGESEPTGTGDTVPTSPEKTGEPESQEPVTGLPVDREPELDALFPDISRTRLEAPEQLGYIVEFKEIPLVDKKLELEKKFDKEKDKAKILTEIRARKNKIEQEHAKALADIKKILPKKTLQPKHYYFNVFNGTSLDITDEEAEEIKKSEYVKAVYKNQKVYATLMDSVPLINADDVWQLDEDLNPCATSGKDCLTGKGTTIAIIDTGVDYTHPDLGGCFGSGCKVIGGYDFINNDANPMDDHGHGTHVAATAAGNGTLKGVAPDAKIIAYKVLDADGGGSFASVKAGVDKAVDPNGDGNFDDKVDIISMSLGADCRGYSIDCGPDDPISQAVDRAVDAGVIAVIAAGNRGPRENTIGSPGTARKAITVGAADKFDVIAGFSSRGPVNYNGEILFKPDIVAPGVNICAAQYDSAWNDKKCFDDTHVAISGTSMATPHVAGAVALLKQKNRSRSVDEIKSVLKASAINLGKSPLMQGAGRVDVGAAITIENPLIVKIATKGKFFGRDMSIPVIGTATGIGMLKYVLSYNKKYSFGSWTEICSSNSQKQDDVLCVWDAAILDEGEYFLKLTAFGNGGFFSDYSLVEIRNTEISFPLDFAKYDSWQDIDAIIWRPGELIEIRGIASGTNFESYSLEWCDSSFVCSQEGMEYSGNASVENGLLGIWRVPSRISAGFYYLRLVNSYNGRNVEYSIIIDVEANLREGWPVYFGGRFFSTCGELDYTLPGLECAVNSYAGSTQELTLLSSDGTKLWGSKLFGSNSDRPGYLRNPPTIGNVDGSPDKEIVITTNGDWGYATNDDDRLGKIFIFDLEGNILNDWQKIASPTYIGRGDKFGGYYNPLIYDLEGDGRNEIIVLDEACQLNVFNGEGIEKPGFPKTFGSLSIVYPDFPSFVFSNTLCVFAPIIGNFDDDPITKEIAVVIGYMDPTQLDSLELSDIYIVSSTGRILKNIRLDYRILNSPIAVDVTQDGKQDLVLITFWYAEENVLYIIDSSGEILLSRIEPTNQVEFNNFIVSDLEGDSIPEIILNLTIGDPDPTVWNPKTELNIISTSNGQKICSISPVEHNSYSLTADLTGDNKLEIITNTSKGISAWDSNCQKLNQYTLIPVTGTGDAMDLVENNGSLEITASTFFGYLFSWSIGEGQLLNSWSTFQHDPQHTGCYDCENEYACTDSDGGQELYVKGTTTGRDAYGGDTSRIATYTDRCDGAERVMEFSCNYINCPEGCVSMSNEVCPLGCNDGACIRCEGDTDDSGSVDVFDVINVVNAFGSSPGNPKWFPGADLDGDGTVTVFDVIDVINNFGKTC